jgi:hypothetical protein
MSASKIRRSRVAASLADFWDRQQRRDRERRERRERYQTTQLLQRRYRRSHAALGRAQLPRPGFGPSAQLNPFPPLF